MRSQILMIVCLAAGAVGTAAQRAAPPVNDAATLSGTITASVGNAPVVGAGVTVLDGDFKFVKGTLTEPNGKYVIDGLVTRRAYWVKYCHEDFTPAFKPITLPTTVDLKLSRRNATVAYWSAETDVFLLGQAPTNETFGKTWQKVEASGLSPEGKTYVAKNLMQRGANPNLWASDLRNTGMHLIAYAKADPMTVSAAERFVWSDVNDPTLSKLDPIILTDITSHKVAWRKVLVSKSPSDPCVDPFSK